jgi:hypothetical protein
MLSRLHGLRWQANTLRWRVHGLSVAHWRTSATHLRTRATDRCARAMDSRALKTASRHLVQSAGLEAVQHLRGRAVEAASRSSIHGCVMGAMHGAAAATYPLIVRHAPDRAAAKELDTVQGGILNPYRPSPAPARRSRYTARGGAMMRSKYK